MIDIINDLSKLTKMSESSLKNLASLSMDCISFGVAEGLKSGNQECVVDIGIGTISILATNDCVKYKFIPSRPFMDAMESAIKGEKTMLEKKLEEKLTQRILTAYKELL